MDSKLFWGIVIILIGFSMILNHVFKVDIPFFKVIIALVIIYFGVSMLMGSFGVKVSKQGEHTSVFTTQRIKSELIDRDEEFNCVFGNMEIDLRHAEIRGNEHELEINSVFGSTKVFLPEGVRFRLKSSAFLGNVKTPTGNQSSIGESKTSLGDETAEKTIWIEANAVFGNIVIRTGK
jgi:predicted membrane protein